MVRRRCGKGCAGLRRRHCVRVWFCRKAADPNTMDDYQDVFSTLASTRVVNAYPESPIDGWPTAHPVRVPVRDEFKWVTVGGVPYQERIDHSRIQKTLEAIKETIDKLMAQNPQNRVAVCACGANATVLMPLAHWKRKEDEKGNKLPYLSVGGMET